MEKKNGMFFLYVKCIIYIFRFLVEVKITFSMVVKDVLTHFHFDGWLRTHQIVNTEIF